jgi:hypothetical protein
MLTENISGNSIILCGIQAHDNFRARRFYFQPTAQAGKNADPPFMAVPVVDVAAYGTVQYYSIGS